MEGSTVCFDTPYVHYRPEKGMITIARAGSLGQGRKDELAEADPTTPGTYRSLRAKDKSDDAIAVRFSDWPRLGSGDSHRWAIDFPRIQRTEKKGNCADCNRGTHLLWTSPNIDYRLCQGCAKRRGPAYRTTVNLFVEGCK